jgi:hypothetical protein
METIGNYLIKFAIALICVLIAVQIGIYEGRKMERAEGAHPFPNPPTAVRFVQGVK